ncbi:hypothetical protein AB0478_28880 [Streptomyces sp. NPDC051917]|uniref:hypothetical protein n=1 Tax=Streptomyces sp. NPDC051917 TaxID=3154754 RepID=UPI003450AFB7
MTISTAPAPAGVCARRRFLRLAATAACLPHGRAHATCTTRCAPERPGSCYAWVSKLTGREREVLRHRADGPTNAEIVARRIAAYEAGFLSAR